MTESAQSDQIVERMIGIGRGITSSIDVMNAEPDRMPTEATCSAIPFNNMSAIAIELPETLPFGKLLAATLTENVPWNGLDFATLSTKPLIFERMVSLIRGNTKHLGTDFTMDLARDRCCFAATSAKPMCSALIPSPFFSIASKFGTGFAKDFTRTRRHSVTISTDAMVDKPSILFRCTDRTCLGAHLTTGFARGSKGFATLHTDTLSLECSIHFLVHLSPPQNIVV